MTRPAVRRRPAITTSLPTALASHNLPVWVVNEAVEAGSRLAAIAHPSGTRVRWTQEDLDRIAGHLRRPEFQERRSDARRAILLRLKACIALLRAGKKHTERAKFLRAPAHGVEALWLDKCDGNAIYIIKAPDSFVSSRARNQPHDEESFVRALAASPRAQAVPPLQRPTPWRRLAGLTRPRPQASAGAVHSWKVKRPIADGRIKAWAYITAVLVAAFIAFDLYLGHIKLPVHPAKQAVDLTFSWAMAEAGLLAFLAAAGLLSKGRFDGVLIDGARNRLSLARLQGALWFGLIGGTYLTEAMWNIGHGFLLPTASVDLWRVLGVAAGTPLASQLVLSSKANVTTPPTAAMIAAQSQGFTLPAPTPTPGQDAQLGLLDRNVTPVEASWADLYLGEEVSNRNDVDPSRLQQLVATVGLAVVFVEMLHKTLTHVVASGASMPTPDANFQWLLAISSGTYLASKAVPR